MTDKQPAARTGGWAGGGIPMGRIAGVPLVVSPWWIVIVVVLTFGFEPNLRDQVHGLARPESYAVAAGFVLLLYASVLVHELSHVLVAKALGMRVRRVVLQLLGGVSEILEQPRTPAREYMVAAVGPMTSILLVGVAAALVPLTQDHTIPWALALAMLWTNAFVAAFNLLPGLPLDGGRVLSAVIWQITKSKDRGIVAAAWVGRAVAIAVAVVALGSGYGRGGASFNALYGLILAMFIWTNASVALAQTKVSSALPKLDLRAMTRRALAVSPELPVAEAVRRARDATARALVVVDSYGRPSGLVSEAAVTALPAQRQPWVSVSDLARPVEDGLLLRTDMTGEALLTAVQTTPATEYLVVEPTGAVHGVLARTDLVAALQAAGVR